MASDIGKLQDIRMVLVEPAGPLNVGSIARVMKNMGLSQLVLVQPHCQIEDIEAVRMAVHAADVLSGATVVASLEEALLDCRLAIGTVGRTQPMEFKPRSPRAAMPMLLQPENLPAAIVFGPEDRGLNNRELSLCQQHVFIPTAEVYPSMNLAQAVGVCAYELRLAALGGDLPDVVVGEVARPLPTGGATADAVREKVPAQVLDGFYHHLEQVLLQIGFVYPHTAPRKIRKFRRLFDRAQLTVPDVALLRGVLRQLAWADRNLPEAKLARKQSEDV